MEVKLLLTPASLGVAALTLILTAYVYHRRVTAWSVVPKGIPWVPERLPWHKWLLLSVTRIRAHLSDFQSGTDLVVEGYMKVLSALQRPHSANTDRLCSMGVMASLSWYHRL